MVKVIFAIRTMLFVVLTMSGLHVAYGENEGSKIKTVPVPANAITRTKEVVDKESCDCPKLKCNLNCEYEKSVTFYSEKCARGTKTRSCARPTCIPLDPVPAACQDPSQAAAAQEKPKSKVMTQEEDKIESPVVGFVNYMEGSAWIESGGGRQALKSGDEVREKDLVKTDDEGKVSVKFHNGNVLNVLPDTQVRIAQMTTGAEDKAMESRRAVIELMSGKIKSKVNQKYKNDKVSYYRIQTKTAVAGVRGTEFAMSVKEMDRDLVSKIETLDGSVELSDRTFEQKIQIAKFESSTYVAPKSTIFSDDGKVLGPKGYLTPVTKLSDREVLALRRDVDFGINVAGSNVEQETSRVICAEPQGKMNQCAWTCENNPNGERKCRTDMPGVACTRRRCDGNGKWMDETRLPKTFGEMCKGSGATVATCDY